MFPKINLFKGYIFTTYMEQKCIHFYKRKIPTLEFVLPSRQPHNYNNIIMIFFKQKIMHFGCLGLKGTVDTEIIM